MEPTPSDGLVDLLRTLEALSSPTRLALLARLGEPAFVTDLAQGMSLSRQAVQKHLSALQEVGLVEGRESWRGAAHAIEYVASPAGLFAFRETLHALSTPAERPVRPPAPTRPAPSGGSGASPAGRGLLLVHGDVPGRWFPLDGGRSEWIVGRTATDHVCLAYDPFASARHALLQRGPDGWRIADLRSRNGTRLNLRSLPAGGACAIRPGDLLTIGRSHLLLREGA